MLNAVTKTHFHGRSIFSTDASSIVSVRNDYFFETQLQINWHNMK